MEEPGSPDSDSSSQDEEDDESFKGGEWLAEGHPQVGQEVGRRLSKLESIKVCDLTWELYGSL